VETPWHNGDGPVIEVEPWRFPPSWMQRYADKYGFSLRYEESPHCPEGRILYIFE